MTPAEALGFDPTRLARLGDHLAGIVAAGEVAGVSVLLMRHGRVALSETFGMARLEPQAPLKPDTLFRIYSMTKPIASVALMTLFEEGRWGLDDPITRFLPEFEGARVFVGEGDDGAILTVPAARAPTMRELMSHTAGLGYGLFDHHPVERAYKAAGVLRSCSLETLAHRAAALPLMFQPGEEWFYSIGADLQGLIVERITGRPFGEVLQARIFDPLGMTDTGFCLNPEQIDRLAVLYAAREGGLAPAETILGVPVTDPAEPPFEGGGGGLFSTAPDYERFCRMILNGGELDGARILAPATVRLMTTNAIPEAVLARTHPLRLLPFNPAFGFGLGFSILHDPARMGSLEGRGTLAWGGGGGTWFWIDPENDLVFVGLIARTADPVSDAFRKTARVLTYQALTRPDL